MSDFIATHPEFTYILLGLLGMMVVFLYKGNENKAALLIAGKLDTIAEKLDVLFSKDTERKSEAKLLEARTARLEASCAKQVQRCDDRERHCPGNEIKQSLERARGVLSNNAG